MGRLNHPNIVHIYDFGRSSGGWLYIAMELVEGSSLRDLVEEKAVDQALALDLVRQICEALDYAHGCGFIHRDIKPANILIDGTGTVKVVDFGLAKLLAGREVSPGYPPEQGLTRDDIVMGTAGYVAPEWLEGSESADERSDLYSLGVHKEVNKDLVDIMKNFMAQKTFSRGIESLGAEASMVFMGNTKKSVDYMMKYSHIFEPLPDKYIDSAFLDRIHAYLPGWEVSPIRNELFSGGYGLIVDYFAEILRHLRTEDFSHLYEEYFQIESDITTRDRDGVRKTFGGLMKILYPHRKGSKEEVREVLHFAMECRKRVKDHIVRIDETFSSKDFEYGEPGSGKTVVGVKTPEQLDNPEYSGALESEDTKTPPVPEEKDGALIQDEAVEGEDKSEEVTLSRTSRVPLADLPLDELIAKDESPYAEFKSTLRINLHTGKKDPNMELMVLKTIGAFLNSFEGGDLDCWGE